MAQNIDVDQIENHRVVEQTEKSAKPWTQASPSSVLLVLTSKQVYFA